VYLKRIEGISKKAVTSANTALTHCRMRSLVTGDAFGGDVNHVTTCYAQIR